MPTRIEPIPMPGAFHLELTVRSPHGEVRRDANISDALYAVGAVGEDNFAYEAAKLGKVCFRNIAMKQVKEVHADKDERMQGLIARATWIGTAFNVPTKEESEARRAHEKRVEKTLWYSMWWTMLQVIHSVRFYSDKLQNGLLHLWLKLDPGGPKYLIRVPGIHRKG